MKKRKKAKVQGSQGKLFAQTMIIILILVLIGLLITFIRLEKDFYHVIVLSALDIGLIVSLLANWVQLLKIKKLVEGDAPRPQKKQAVVKTAPAKRVVKAVDPKVLPDPGLVFRYDLNKTKSNQKQIIIGQTDGSIKTYSTEILNDHLSIDIRVKVDSERDIYDTSQAIFQSYQVDLRRGGRVMIFYPGMERYREMDSRERLLIAPEADGSGDFQFKTIEPKNPVRFQLGDRLRADGKFIKGYMEFHLFTKEVETQVGEYTRKDNVFLLRLYKIFPGYDTANPTEDGFYPMIDPYITR